MLDMRWQPLPAVDGSRPRLPSNIVLFGIDIMEEVEDTAWVLRNTVVRPGLEVILVDDSCLILEQISAQIRVII